MSSEVAVEMHGGRWKRYHAYRDSGVEWLGEVPEEWSASSVKHYFYIQLGKMLQNKPDSVEDMLVPYAKALHVLWGNVVTDDLTEMWAHPSDIQQYGIKAGDLLVCEGGEVGRAAIVTSPPKQCIIQNALHRVRAKKSNELCFLQYVLYAVSSSTWLDVLCNKATIAHFTREKFADLRIPVPSLPEQRAIATFLDRETGRIDTLIEKKERQVELLQEKRAALISHAVTKGLDPDVKMKDSGVEWLGEVPEDWKLKRIKQIASKIGSGKTPKGGSEVYSESGVTFLRSQNIHFDGLRLDDVVFIKESIDEEMFSTRVFSNDVLLNITGASLGRCNLVPDNFTPANVNQHVCIVRPIKKSIVPLFLYNVFASKVVQAQIFSWENGSSREGLTFPQIANLVIVAPDDLEEQHSIAAFLDLETGRIDTLTTKIRESTQKLREYRTALISAAVTGKIDVRNKET